MISVGCWLAIILLSIAYLRGAVARSLRWLVPSTAISSAAFLLTISFPFEVLAILGIVTIAVVGLLKVRHIRAAVKSPVTHPRQCPPKRDKSREKRM